MENQKDKRYLKAKERVKEIKVFYGHLTIFIIVNLFLLTINYLTDGLRYPWFLWVTVSWGIGMLFSALRTFRINPFYSEDWEERKIKEYMEKEKTQRWE